MHLPLFSESLLAADGFPGGLELAKVGESPAALKNNRMVVRVRGTQSWPQRPRLFSGCRCLLGKTSVPCKSRPCIPHAGWEMDPIVLLEKVPAIPPFVMMGSFVQGCACQGCFASSIAAVQRPQDSVLLATPVLHGLHTSQYRQDLMPSQDSSACDFRAAATDRN